MAKLEPGTMVRIAAGAFAGKPCKVVSDDEGPTVRVEVSLFATSTVTAVPREDLVLKADDASPPPKGVRSVSSYLGTTLVAYDGDAVLVVEGEKEAAVELRFERGADDVPAAQRRLVVPYATVLDRRPGAWVARAGDSGHLVWAGFALATAEGRPAGEIVRFAADGSIAGRLDVPFAPTCLAVSGNGRFAIVGERTLADQCCAHLFDLDDLDAGRTAAIASAWVAGSHGGVAAVSRDGRRVVVAGEGMERRALATLFTVSASPRGADALREATVLHAEHGGHVRAVAFSRDGKTCALVSRAGGRDLGHIFRADDDSGTPVSTFEVGMLAAQVALSADGGILVVAGDGEASGPSTAIVGAFDVASGKAIMERREVPGHVGGAGVADDGREVALVRAVDGYVQVLRSVVG